MGLPDVMVVHGGCTWFEGYVRSMARQMFTMNKERIANVTAEVQCINKNQSQTQKDDSRDKTSHSVRLKITN